MSAAALINADIPSTKGLGDQAVDGPRIWDAALANIASGVHWIRADGGDGVTWGPWVCHGDATIPVLTTATPIHAAQNVAGEAQLSWSTPVAYQRVSRGPNDNVVTLSSAGVLDWSAFANRDAQHFEVQSFGFNGKPSASTAIVLTIDPDPNALDVEVIAGGVNNSTQDGSEFDGLTIPAGIVWIAAMNGGGGGTHPRDLSFGTDVASVETIPVTTPSRDGDTYILSLHRLVIPAGGATKLFAHYSGGDNGVAQLLYFTAFTFAGGGTGSQVIASQTSVHAFGGGLSGPATLDATGLAGAGHAGIIATPYGAFFSGDVTAADNTNGGPLVIGQFVGNVAPAADPGGHGHLAFTA